MGCCLTTPPKKPDPVPTHAQLPTTTRSVSSRRHSIVAPPQPEEETIVKEVLSETPAPKPKLPTRFVTRVREEEKPVPEIHKKASLPLVTTNADVSEASDITASTLPPEDDYSGEVQQVVGRTPARTRRRAFSGERREWGAPVRKSLPSPARERNPRRRDSGGEGSFRRDKSPATRSGLGRSHSSRKTGKSPGRVRTENPTRMVEERAKKEEELSKLVAPGDESLENPLVSLECFIFL